MERSPGIDQRLENNYSSNVYIISRLTNYLTLTTNSYLCLCTDQVVDSSRRKVIQYYAKTNSIDDDGHGSHCAGTILGKVCTGTDCSPSGTNRDGNAPEAKIAVYDIGDTSDYVYPDNADPMFVRGMAAGATVHSASWGNGVNSYQSRDRDFDRFQYDNPEFLVVSSAGNSGNGNNLNSASGNGKNNLNVCATRNKGEGQGELYAASFSSMGPSQDGRIKPDICAPGQVIYSADNGANRQCKSVGYSGTSMACPGVAGAALLIRQYFMDGFYPFGTKQPADGFTPSGALIKAVILNSGRAMLGRDSSNLESEPYDESQGFGLISLVDGLYLEGKSKGKVIVYDDLELTNEQEWEETFALGDCPAEHTSVTLNYFDKENSSTSCNPCIVNRLDLTVEKGTQIFYPNGRDSADELNNAQRIRIPKDQDTITVKVKAANLATANQKFALVISGCVDIGTKNPTASPTTSMPTKTANPGNTPTSTPSSTPSMLPSTVLECQSFLVVDLTTDRFSSETGWTVKDSAGNLILSNPVLAISQTYTTSKYLPLKDECYTFEITDSYGDGICCTFGYGEYTVSLDGSIIKDGGEFAYSESVDFCTTAPVTSVPTTEAPTTLAPTTAAPTTLAPTTTAPTTAAPSTAVPTTITPTTEAPDTAAPTTAAPSTASPITLLPTTATPTTKAPTTTAPTTVSPTTEAPTISGPNTAAPTPQVSCEDLSRKECRKLDTCAYGPRKLSECLPKERFEFDCSTLLREHRCKRIEACTFETGTCLHKCDGITSIAECKEVTKDNDKPLCKFVKENNPCATCKPITCS